MNGMSDISRGLETAEQEGSISVTNVFQTPEVLYWHPTPN